MKERKREMKDRFDLEDAIMQAWQTVDDIRLVTEEILDGKTPLNEDEIANALIGLEYLHKFRCSKLFDIFEELLRTHQFVNLTDQQKENL